MRFLLGLLIITFILLVILCLPNISVFILAFVFGVMFMPVNRWLATYLHKNIAAILTAILVIVLIAGPVTFAINRIVHEALSLLATLQSTGATSANIAPWIQDKIHAVIPQLNLDVTTYVKDILSFFVGKIGTIFSTFLTLLLSILALIYWFKDSDKLKAALIAVSPLSDADDRSILDALSRSVHGIIRGSLLVAIVQGVVAGIGFSIFDIPNPALWAAVTAICALVPALGTSIVTLPMVIYLFVTGDTTSGLGLALWGAGAVGLVDNLVGPYFMSRGQKVHPFFILISILGAVMLLGPIGLFAGPIIVALFFAVFDVYTSHVKSHKEHDIVVIPEILKPKRGRKPKAKTIE